MQPLLTIENLHTSFRTYAGTVEAVRGVDLTVHQGEVVAVVGESGSGKSVTMLAVMGLLANNARVTGKALYRGADLLALREHDLNKIRGREIAMVFQDSLTGLNPTLTVGRQLTEGMEYHLGLDAGAAHRRAVELLQLVGVSEPERRLHQYPHEFSGGMRQRVMIAIALACNPSLLIADEPTTALDVTIQAQILALLESLQRELQMSVVIITHNLGVVAGLADRVAVMYGGQLAEIGPVDQIYQRPQHPYTRALLRSVPRLDLAQRRLESIPGSPPNLLAPPPGCPFHPRCPHAMQVCAVEAPILAPVGPDHRTGCWLHQAPAPLPWEVHP